jgi:hypothetical protein
MATDPAFAVTPRIGSVAIATAETSLASPTNFGTLITAVAAGTRVAEIVVKAAATTAASIVRVFLHDGTTYWLLDEIVVAAATSSNTGATTRVSVLYQNLVLPNASWSIRVTTSIAQATHVTALGADL